MASYIVRRTRPNVAEDSTHELKSSHLFLIGDTKTETMRTFVLKWLIDRPLALQGGYVYAAHYVRFDRTIHRLRITRLENCHPRRYLVGMTPFWGYRNKVEFCVVEDDFRIHPERSSFISTLNVPDRKCFFEFVEPLSLRNALHIAVTVECRDSLLDIDIDRHSDLVPDMQNLMTDGGELSDIAMVVGGEEFKLHVAVLSARSPVFRAMFAADMRERNTGRLVVEGTDHGTFRQFVRYLYTGKTDALDSEVALGLLEWADKYQVDDLRREAVEFLAHNVEREHVLRVFLAADATNELELKNVASSYIAENLNALMQSGDWSLVRNRADLLEDILRNFIY